jgi:cytidyltransferase-like protein
MSERTVLVFGTFDGLHEGHLFLLREAKKLGTKLIVSVAQDSVVGQLKKHPPKHPLPERMAALLQSGLVDEAVAGDRELGNFTAVRNWKPNIIALGYDQTKLEEKLGEFIAKENLPIQLIKISAHEPNRLHSRLLRKN